MAGVTSEGRGVDVTSVDRFPLSRTPWRDALALPLSPQNGLL